MPPRSSLPVAPLLALLLAPSAASAACPADLGELARQVDQALEAYATMDTDLFFSAQRSAREAVGCLEELAEPAQVAPFHGVEGLAAFLMEDDEATVASFRSALAADPSWSLPESVAPPGSLLEEPLQRAAELGTGPTHPLLGSSGFHLVVDGEPDADRPAERPYVLQVVTEDWDVLWSGPLAAHDDLPAAALNPQRFSAGSSALSQALGGEERFDRSSASRLGYGAAAFGAAALGLATASGISAARRSAAQKACIEDHECVANEDAWAERVGAMHHRSVALGWSAAGCGLAAGGLAVGAVLEKRF